MGPATENEDERMGTDSAVLHEIVGTDRQKRSSREEILVGARKITLLARW